MLKGHGTTCKIPKTYGVLRSSLNQPNLNFIKAATSCAFLTMPWIICNPLPPPPLSAMGLPDFLKAISLAENQAALCRTAQVRQEDRIWRWGSCQYQPHPSPTQFLLPTLPGIGATLTRGELISCPSLFPDSRCAVLALEHGKW